jgi:tRNA nucleotidyltransferase (CCA-adding enzyme)
MTAQPRKIEPQRLAERLDALAGIERTRAASAGLRAYLVGGAVRDLLLGRDRADLDIAVEGDPLELARRLGGELRAHARFLTATVKVDGTQIDLAATRAETYPRPGALPVISRADLRSDLARRDFTVNAMAVALSPGSELVDPHGGLADVERGVLRTLHERSLIDDPTRALRAARYASRYGFELDTGTEAQLRAADLRTVSGERIDAELRKLARERGAGRGFELLEVWGLIDLAPDGVKLAAAVDDLLDAQPWAEVADRGEAVAAAALGRGGDAARRLAEATPSRPSEAVSLARGFGGVELALGRALGAEWLDSYVSDWRTVRLEIDGDDLLAAGVGEGPAIGRGLAAALRAKLDEEVAGPEEELRVALRAAREDSRP